MIVKRSNKADAVLAVIDDITRDRQDPDILIRAEAYVNGREHGWKLYTDESEGAVLFAENRNSDNIVVYVESNGTYKYADRLSDEAYSGRIFFRYDEYLKAAKFIVKALGIKA